MAERQWFVFYTKSRHEKKVHELLLKRGFQAFLPLVTTVKQWSDRKKKVESPLFRSYIFVYVFDYQIPDVLTLPGVAWNIKYNNKPAVVREEEISIIKRFVDTGLFIEASEISNKFSEGDQVRVIDGPLKGLNGIIFSKEPNDFNVQISSIQQNLKIRLPSYMLEKLSN